MSTDAAATPQPPPPPPPPNRPRSRRRLWSLRLLAVGLSLLAGVTAAELAVRVFLAARGCTVNCYASEVLLFQHHPENGFEPAPGFEMQSVVLHVQVNSHGLRGNEIPFEKPEGVRRVAVLGGSSAFGYFMSEGEYASALLEERLRRDGEQVEVLNGAVPSYHSEQVIRRYRERIAPLQPDVVILYLGWNDQRRIAGEDESQAKAVDLKSPVERWLAAHSALWGLLRYRLFPPPPPFVPPAEGNLLPTAAGAARFESRLEELAAAIAQTPAQMIVCCQAMAAHPQAAADLRRELSDDPARQEQMIELGQYLHRTLKEFAARHHAPFVDAYSEIPATYEYLGDGVHLTARGEQRLAELWTDPVRASLAGEADK